MTISTDATPVPSTPDSPVPPPFVRPVVPTMTDPMVPAMDIVPPTVVLPTIPVIAWPPDDPAPQNPGSQVPVVTTPPAPSATGPDFRRREAATFQTDSMQEQYASLLKHQQDNDIQIVNPWNP